MTLRHLTITLAAIAALSMPAAAQTWGDKLIDRLKADKDVEQNLVVSRDPKTKKIDTESYTFRFKSANTYNSLRKELGKHLEDAEMFTQDDSQGRIILRVNAGKDRVGIYQISKEGKGQYCLKVFRSAGGVAKGLEERERLLREDAEANARYQSAYEEGMDMRDRILREAEEENTRYQAAYDAGRAERDRILREAEEQEARNKGAYEYGRAERDRILREAGEQGAQPEWSTTGGYSTKSLEEKQRIRKERIASEQTTSRSVQSARRESSRSAQQASRVRQQARQEAAKARQEALREAQKARQEAAKARQKSLRESQQARQEALREAQKARQEAAKTRTRRVVSSPTVKVIQNGNKDAKQKEAKAHEDEVRRKLDARKKQL